MKRRGRHGRTGRRTLIVLLVVFVALAAVTVFQNAQQDSQQGLPFERVYPEFAEADIQAIRLRNPASAETFTINRSLAGTWISPDHEGSLDQEIALVMVRTVVFLPYDHTLPDVSDEALTDYGFFEDGRMIIEVLLTDAQTHAVVVGRRSPSDLVYYGLVDDRQEVYLIYRGAIDFLSAQLRTPPVA